MFAVAKRVAHIDVAIQNHGYRKCDHFVRKSRQFC